MFRSQRIRQEIRRFFLQLVAWFCFVFAVVNVSNTIIRYSQDGYLGPAVETSLGLVFAVALVVWWRLK
jgi:hypothetical protein